MPQARTCMFVAGATMACRVSEIGRSVAAAASADKVGLPSMLPLPHKGKCGLLPRDMAHAMLHERAQAHQTCC